MERSHGGPTSWASRRVAPTAVLLAVMRPERISSAILFGTFACATEAARKEYPAEVQLRAERTLDEFAEIFDHWGDGGRLMMTLAPSVKLTEAQKRMFGMWARAAASPRMARALIETALRVDVRDVLTSVRLPALVVHTEGDHVVPIEAGRQLADGIAGARFVTLPGINHAFWLAEGLVEEVERFVTGAIHHAEPNRILASILFTDIVSSTQRAAELGRPFVAGAPGAPR